MLKRQARRKHRLGSLERDILADLSAGDLLYGFLLSAHSSRLMFKRAREHAQYRYRKKKAIERLKKMKFIIEHGHKLSITEKGADALGDAIHATAALLQNGTRWDGRWRIVVFDIPEKYRLLRNHVRNILKRAGFVQLQQSVWVFPHDCKELVQLIQRESALSKFILYGVLERIESEERLKKLFRI